MNNTGDEVEQIMNLEDQAKFNNFMADKVRKLEEKQDSHTIELAANTAVTSKILDIVEKLEGIGNFSVKWGNRIRTFLIWITPILGSLVALRKLAKDYIELKLGIK